MPQVIRLQISTGSFSSEIGDRVTLETCAIRALAKAGLILELGPISIYHGTAVFPLDNAAGYGTESELTLTFHEGTPQKTIKAWVALRDRVPGVDCGRVWISGKSWCAKAFANDFHGRAVFPDCEFSSVREA